MLILGLETTGPKTKVGLLDLREEKFISKEDPREFSHNEVIIGLIDEVLSLSGLEHISKVDLIGVSLGPGYFTSLRVGITLAKAFYFTHGIPVVGVISLMATAYDYTLKGEKLNEGDLIIPYYHAGRGLNYIGIYRFKGILDELKAPFAGRIEEIKEELRGTPHHIVGPDLFPSSFSICSLAYKVFKEIGPSNPLILEPLYVLAPDVRGS